MTSGSAPASGAKPFPVLDCLAECEHQNVETLGSPGSETQWQRCIDCGAVRSAHDVPWAQPSWWATVDAKLKRAKEAEPGPFEPSAEGTRALLDEFANEVVKLRAENLDLQRQINEANASGFTPAAEAMIDGTVAEQVRFETALKHIGESDPRWHSYMTDVLENTAAPSTTEPAGPLEPMIETLRKLDPVEAARIEDWFKEFNVRRGR